MSSKGVGKVKGNVLAYIGGTVELGAMYVQKLGKASLSRKHLCCEINH